MDGSNDPDEEALDAYSRIVSSVAERLIPAVASLRVSRSMGGWSAGGAGSAVAFAPVTIADGPDRRLSLTTTRS